jgi:hypothetical protein
MPSTGMFKLLFSFSVGTACRYLAMLIIKSHNKWYSVHHSLALKYEWQTAYTPLLYAGNECGDKAVYCIMYT